MKFFGNNLKAVFIIILTLIFCTSSFGKKNAGTVCDNSVINKVIFELLVPADLPAVATQYGLDPTPCGQVGTPPTYLMQINNGQTPAHVVAAMNNDGRITKPEINKQLSSVERQGLPWTQGRSWSVGRSWSIGGSVKGYNRQWFPKNIRLDEAHEISKGSGVTVAVLDTGIDPNHPAFTGKLVPGFDFVDNDNDPTEVGIPHQGSYGHGTHVAGIVAMTAPEAKIMPIRILDSDGSGELWRIVAAIIFAAENGADIINMSFGYDEQVLLLKDIMDFCDDGVTPDAKTFDVDERMVFIAAAGNAGQIGNGTNFIFPAAERAFSVSGLLSVAASTRYNKLASFSSMSDGGGSGGDRWVRSVAPGDEIISAMPGGRYGMWSGTSMAAPIAAGVAALVKASSPPNITPIQIVDRLDDTGFEWDCFYAPRNIQIKTSRLDALCAVANTGNQACGVEANVCQISNPLMPPK